MLGTEGLAKSGKINSTREDIGKRIGELFVNRFYINLHTDILDTPGKQLFRLGRGILRRAAVDPTVWFELLVLACAPSDIFWDNDDFADHYDHCRRYLEIPKRVEILNQRWVFRT